MKRRLRWTMLMVATAVLTLLLAGTSSLRAAPTAVGWVGNMNPAGHSDSTIDAGDALTVTVQVYKGGVTDSAGQGANIDCTLHWSPVSAFGGSWTSPTDTAMSYDSDTGNDDVYTATINPGQGIYEFTANCTDTTDSQTVWQQDGNGRLTVNPSLGNTLSLPAASGLPGSSGSVALSLDNVDAMSAGSIVFTYNPALLSITGGTATGRTTGSLSESSGTVTITTGAIAAGSGAIFNINYTVPAGATPGQSSALDLTNATSLTGASELTLTDGSFFVQDPNAPTNPTTFVHLFEWRWKDIEKECPYLAEKGYDAVQISPPHEHILPSVDPSHPWWVRYQVVSYSLDQSRSGSLQDFRDMVSACTAVGVDIYADVILNHMTGSEYSGVGTAGSSFNGGTKDFPAVPYSASDFHGNGTITDWGDPNMIRTHNLLSLLDLATESSYVRSKEAAYLNALIAEGVAGARLDAAKHMYPADIEAIKNQLTDPDFYIFGEVIDLGGDVVSSSDYSGIIDVTEFKYSNDKIANTFNCSPNISSFETLGSGMLPSDKAVVFVNNHDNQRGHGVGGPCILDYRDNTAVHDLANVFMLAHPYGYARVMSSYYWDGNDDNAGPPTVNGPAGSSGETRPVYDSGQVAGDVPANCADGTNWVCEHRRTPIANMVAFRDAADGEPMTNWWDNNANQIAFGRGDKGYVVINRQATVLTRTFQTGMAEGQYCDVIHGELLPDGSGCTGPVIAVDASGQLVDQTVAAMDGLAIHANAQVNNSVELPQVDITAPATGSTQNGQFTVTVNASHSEGIVDVALTVDGAAAGTDSTAPYEFVLDATSYGSGTHTVVATATASNAQNSTKTDTITFSVPVPPVVNITNPADGATVSGTITISATATHASGIDRVDFFVDGSLVGSDNTPSSASPTGLATTRLNTAETTALSAANATTAITIDGSASDWSAADLIATSPANDSAQTSADCLSGQYCVDGHNWSAHERQVDFVGLYATWDATDIYFGIQGADVIDVLDPANANSGDPTYTWDGGLMFIAVDTQPGGYSTGGDMWDKPQEFVGTNLPDYQIYFSHSFWQGGPFVRAHDGTAWATYTAPDADLGETHAMLGLDGASGASYMAGTPIVGYHTWDDVDNYDFVAGGYDTSRSGWYEMKVPLSLLGNPDLENGCIEVFVGNSWSGLDSLPKDPATLDTPGVSDSNSPLEWSDTDQNSVPFVKIGNGANCVQTPANEYSVDLDVSGYAPGVHNVEAVAVANDDPQNTGSDTSTFVIDGSAPDIDAAPASLSATLSAGATEDQTLTIGNLGSAALAWSIAEDDAAACDSPSDLGWVSVSPGSGTTAVSSSSDVTVTFEATGLAPATYSGQLCITSDDPDEALVAVPVSLTVSENPVPDIDVAPASLSATLSAGATEDQTLTIGNTGSAALAWSIAEDDAAACDSPSDLGWVSVSPGSGTTAVATSSDVTVTFNATGLAPATYSGQLCITSDDPDEALVAVPVSLTVPGSGDAVLAVTPSSTTVAEGSTFTVDLTVSDATDFYGVDVALTFDATKLQVVDADAGTPGVQITPGSCPQADFVQGNTADNSAGTISYIALALNPTPPCPDGTVASVTFTAVGLTPSTPITISSADLSTTGGSPISRTLQHGSVTIEEANGTVTGTATRQGASDHSGLVVTAWDGATEVGSTTTDAAGSYTLSLPDGTYRITIEGSYLLDAEKSGVTVTVGNTTTLTAVALLAGDLDDSDTINIFDLTVVGSQYGNTSASPGWDARADLTQDGTVSIFDMSIMGGNYGKSSPVNWP